MEPNDPSPLASESGPSTTKSREARLLRIALIACLVSGALNLIFPYYYREVEHRATSQEAGRYFFLFQDARIDWSQTIHGFLMLSLALAVAILGVNGACAYWKASPRLRHFAALASLVVIGLITVCLVAGVYSLLRNNVDERRASAATLIPFQESAARRRALSAWLDSWYAKLNTPGIDDNSGLHLVPESLLAAMAAHKCQFSIVAPFGAEITIGVEKNFRVLLADSDLSPDDHIDFFGFEGGRRATDLKETSWAFPEIKDMNRDFGYRSWGTRAVGKAGPLRELLSGSEYENDYGVHMTGVPAGFYPIHISCPGYDDYLGEMQLVSDGRHHIFTSKLTKFSKKPSGPDAKEKQWVPPEVR